MGQLRQLIFQDNATPNNESWLKLRQASKWITKNGPYVLLFTSFVLSIIGYINNAAFQAAIILLPVALMLIYHLIYEIRELQKDKVVEREYLNLGKLRSSIGDTIISHSRDDTLHIKTIGLTLEKQWNEILPHLVALRDSSSEIQLKFHAVIMDPNLEIPGSNDFRSTITMGTLDRVNHFVSTLNGVQNAKNWEFKVEGTSSVPGVAGILIDDAVLHRTMSDSEDVRVGKGDDAKTIPTICQGDQMYERFEHSSKVGKSYENETIKHFNRIFGFLIYHSSGMLLTNSKSSDGHESEVVVPIKNRTSKKP